jgi:hypothetical protein
MLQIVPDEIFDEIERKEKVVLFFYRNVQFIVHFFEF